MGDADEIEALGEAANAGDAAALESLIALIAEGKRRQRQKAAAAVAEIARANPEALKPYTGALVDALNRPEAQTRWEALDGLTELVAVDSRTCDKGIAGAETALFDEESGPVRLAAMRFLCRIGATTEFRSERVWPLIDEGIQCYHGDLEFQDMLDAVEEFSVGKIAPSVRESLIERLTFDATSGKGTIKKKTAHILEKLGANQ